eukprot:EC097051.1.p1 GENE.EC097051.1~~EC097051.1.p1  ORF type:complete len:162 (-),score=18.56 EC097051.1:106-591(-)
MKFHRFIQPSNNNISATQQHSLIILILFIHIQIQNRQGENSPYPLITIQERQQYKNNQVTLKNIIQLYTTIKIQENTFKIQENTLKISSTNQKLICKLYIYQFDLIIINSELHQILNFDCQKKFKKQQTLYLSFKKLNNSAELMPNNIFTIQNQKSLQTQL